jgi:folylpolyglutamate synthase/dihydropteroate synthase
LTLIAPAVDRAFVAPIRTPRSESAERVVAHLEALGVRSHACGDAAAAVAAALATAVPVVVVTGSIYLVGEVKSALKQESAIHEAASGS